MQNEFLNLNFFVKTLMNHHASFTLNYSELNLFLLTKPLIFRTFAY
jgi:hypothetical protein